MSKVILIVIILFILVCLLAMLVSHKIAFIGGDENKKILPSDTPKDIVIDTLNLAHWVKRRSPKRLGFCEIINTIDLVSPLLKKDFSRITFITKDKNIKEGDLYRSVQMRAIYNAAAKRNEVFIDVVEQLPDSNDSHIGQSHSSLARDDFYILKTAWEQKASILSCDRYKDFQEMKSGVIPPFHVFKFSPWSNSVNRDYIRADAPEFRKLRRPRYIFRPEEVLPEYL